MNAPEVPQLGPGFLDHLPAPGHVLVIADKYRVLRLIARGGMGVVYEARQENLNRTVAVKVLASGVHATEDFQQRFTQEAMVAAKLEHQNIVAIYDTGEDHGLPFISMEYVDGRNLAELIKDQPLAPDDAATTVETVARAVHYAHDKGVLHRDLKPSNIIRNLEGRLKITDFGLACAVNARSDLTQTGQALGTPGFMPPEQLAGKDARLGPASDVYGLGATLYCLLTGKPPFFADTPAKTLNQVAHDEPVPLRKLNRGIPRDLETICLKCLEKEASRRYLSAQALADDLQRFVERKPIHARSIGLVGKSLRWCRRRPAMAALVLLVIGLSVAMTAATISAVRSELRAARADAKVATTLKNEQLRRAFFLESQYSRLAVQEAGWFLRVSNSAVMPATARLGVEIHNLFASALQGMEATVHERWQGFEHLEIASSPPGSKILIPYTISDADTVRSPSVPLLRVWDYQTRQTNEFQLRGKGPVAWLSNAVPLQLAANRANRFSYELWNLARSEKWHEFTTAPETLPDERALLSVHSARQINADGTLVAVVEPFSITNGILSVWETATGRRILRSDLPYASTIRALEFSADGSLLAAGAENGYVSIWSLGSGRQWRPFRDNRAEIRSLAFHRESRNDDYGTNYSGWVLAVGDSSRVIALWDLQSVNVHHRFAGHSADVLAFSPDGTTLASGGQDEIRLWDVATGRPLLKVPAGPTQTGVRFSEDGQRLFVSIKSSAGGSMVAWDLENGRGVQALRGLRSPVSKVCFSADGRRVAAFGRNHEVAVWDCAGGRRLRVWPVPHELKGWEAALALNEDGTELAFASERSVRRWDVETGKLKTNLKLRPAIGNVLGFPAPGRLVLFRQESIAPRVVPYPEADATVFPRICRMYDLTRDNPQESVLEDREFNLVANSIKGLSYGRVFLVDGSSLSEGRTNRLLACFDATTGQRRWQRRLGPGHEEGDALRIDSSGQTLVVTDTLAEIGITIELNSGTNLPSQWSEYPVAIGPGGTNWVAWNLKERRGLSLFAGPTAVPLVTLGIDAPIEDGQPTFSRDGNLLAWGQADGSVLVFNLREMQQRMAAMGLSW